jgi:hypothetical protein|eukprot:scaffold11415_cov215-Chaetoceros_neogracile.AAC.1
MKSAIILLAAISHLAQSANIASYQVDAYGETFSATTTYGTRPIRLRGSLREQESFANIRSRSTETTTQATLAEHVSRSSPQDSISAPTSTRSSTSSSTSTTYKMDSDPNDQHAELS